MTRTVSIIVPCRNEERNAVRCLDAIARQNYPHAALEVLVADGRSTDDTRAIVERWRASHDLDVRIVDNPRIVAEFGNAEALKQAAGEIVYLMGMDEEMAQPDMIEAMVAALDRFPDVVGSEQEFLPIPGGNWVNNYLAAIHINDPVARDLVAQPVELDRVKEAGRTYRKFRFSPGYPAKLFFRRAALAPFVGQDTFEEGQAMLRLALDGKNLLATVDGYGVYHHNIASLRQYLRKRAKIALKHGTRTRERKTWVHYTGRSLALVAFAHLTFVWPLAVSLVRAVRYRQPLWLLHAPIGFLTAWVYALSHVRNRLTGRRAW
jgi:glycosyltransferase involved in cell wall biosynthesis